MAGCSVIVDSLNEQRTERTSVRGSTLEANIYQLDVPLRVIEYGRYYTISYRRHNRRMNLAYDSSPCPGVSLGHRPRRFDKRAKQCCVAISHRIGSREAETCFVSRGARTARSVASVRGTHCYANLDVMFQIKKIDDNGNISERRAVTRQESSCSSLRFGLGRRWVQGGPQ